MASPTNPTKLAEIDRAIRLFAELCARVELERIRRLG